jgi:hypothetical protein
MEAGEAIAAVIDLYNGEHYTYKGCPMQRRSLTQFVISLFITGLALAPVFVTLFPQPASSTAGNMAVLPSSQRFQCRICHIAENPVPGSSELNPFGMDFKNNGNIWNRALAELNSDGDNCVNGFELADIDGDGFLDFGADEENSNPGDRNDCSIALSEQTWGKIKDLFSGGN